MTTRKATPREKEVFEFLDDIRDSGEMNMLNTLPLLISDMELPRRDAKSMLQNWMHNSNEDGDYDTIEDTLS